MTILSKQRISPLQVRLVFDSKESAEYFMASAQGAVVGDDTDRLRDDASRIIQQEEIDYGTI